MPDLTEADRRRLAELGERLEGVTRAGGPERDRLTDLEPIDPMLAQPFAGSLDDLEADEWRGECKYDGTRIILEKLDGEVALFTRRHVDRADSVPAIAAAARESLPDGVVLDGEVAFFTPEGTSTFVPIHTSAEKRSALTPRYVVFDCLVRDGRWIIREPLTDRTDRLPGLIEEGPHLSVAPARAGDLAGFFDEVVAGGGEGIMLKRLGSPYHPGTRSRHWRKVKAVDEVDVLAVGYTRGEGARAATFGALVLADPTGYVGRVGSGFTAAALESVASLLEPTEERVVSPAAVGRPYVPVEPIVVTVRMQELTDSRHLRAPVFVRVRPERPPESVDPVETQVA